MLTGLSLISMSGNFVFYQVISFVFHQILEMSLMSDGHVACVATDDSRGALGVAGGGQLLLYLHLPELHSD